MSEIARWSLSELYARYELEPDLDDIYVEGVFDRELLSQSPCRNQRQTAIYEIDCVDIPTQILAKHGLTLGNKQRVVALAFELADLPAHAKVRCLVDRDLDHWFGPLSISPRLRWSIFCSIELHFLVDKCIEDILITTGRAKIKNLGSFISSLHHVLRQLYSLRLADKELALTLKWPSIRKYVKRKTDVIALDIEGYLVAVLHSNGKSKRHADVTACYTSWLNKLNGDIRLNARGHDFSELLAWSMSEFHGLKEFTSPKAIERLFVLLARSISSLSDELRTR